MGKFGKIVKSNKFAAKIWFQFFETHGIPKDNLPLIGMLGDMSAKLRHSLPNSQQVTNEI